AAPRPPLAGGRRGRAAARRRARAPRRRARVCRQKGGQRRRGARVGRAVAGQAGRRRRRAGRARRKGRQGRQGRGQGGRGRGRRRRRQDGGVPVVLRRHAAVHRGPPEVRELRRRQGQGQVGGRAVCTPCWGAPAAPLVALGRGALGRRAGGAPCRRAR
ncbi:MAG: hypothetical protein J3K34DRAFT_527804, partial [Monoraphidium minutum]